MLTGRASRRTTWRIIDEFLDEHASGVPEKKAAPRKRPAKKSATKKAAAKKTAPKKAAATKDAAKTATAKKAATPAKKAARKRAPRADAIGSNPARRYGSASSRSLAAGS